MLNRQMRRLEYEVYNNTTDTLGMRTLSTTKYNISIAVTLNSTSNVSNPIIAQSTYIGYSYDTMPIKAVLFYGDVKLEVTHVNTDGRVNVIYFKEIA